MIFMMKPIYEDITLDEVDIHKEILEDITSDEEGLVADEDLEDITSEEEKEEKTLDEQEGTNLDYDDHENEKYKTHTAYGSDEEEIYEIAQIGSQVVINTFVADEFLELGIHNAHPYLKHNDFLKDKRCIIQIHDDDNLCFARALLVARAYIHKKDPNTVYKWENPLNF
uniref:Uncharacterized protein n=1 Tax=Romanomermis culicivorax TaxID=13658 RepID=A0A915JU32_ROMCU